MWHTCHGPLHCVIDWVVDPLPLPVTAATLASFVDSAVCISMMLLNIGNSASRCLIDLDCCMLSK